MIRITHMRDQPLPDQHRLAGLRGWDEKASMPRPSPSNTEYYLGMIRITHMRDQPLPDQHRLVVIPARRGDAQFFRVRLKSEPPVPGIPRRRSIESCSMPTNAIADELC